MSDTYSHSSIETNGIHLHVVTAGDPHGRPVILLHGFPEFWYGWRHQIPALVSAGFFVIAPDQRGYDLSDKPKEMRAYRLKELVEDIRGLSGHFGFERAAVVGHDWGAAVAWELAIHHPEQVEHLGILNVPHPAVMWEFLHKSIKQLLKSWYIGFFQIPVVPVSLLRFNRCAALAHMLKASGRSGTFSQAEINEYKNAWRQPGAIPAMIDWYRAAFNDRSSMAETHRNRVPTLILWGKKDVALSEEMAVRSIEYCDHGELIYFENSTHWVQHDEAEAVNRELVAFLKS